MKWNYNNKPTFKDIDKNGCPCFLTVRKNSSFVHRDYYNSKLEKWFKDTDCKEEVKVRAWQPFPKFNYDRIKEKSKLSD